MIYKTTSVKQVIAKVFTDLDLQEGDHRINDMVEWCGEALKKIGAFPSFLNKVAGRDGNPILEVTNYQAKLPNDFHRMIQASYSKVATGPFYAIRYATGSFDSGSVTNDASESTDSTYPDSDLIVLAMRLYDLDYEAALILINNDPSMRGTLNGMLNQMDGTSITSLSNIQSIEGGTTTDYTYIINNNYIKTNVIDGYITLAYQAIPLDKEGYPMIPDDESFFEALYWYINMKLLYPQWKSGQVRDAVYYDARRSWNYFSKQAYGNALMPNKDQMESIMNTWHKIVPELGDHSTGFSTTGSRQVIYNAN